MKFLRDTSGEKATSSKSHCFIQVHGVLIELVSSPLL